MAKQGLFVGLVTLDLVYLTATLPNPNQKVVASDYVVTAGGPATNAAVTYSHLGNQATLLGSVGIHPMTQLIHTDLGSYGITLKDLTPSQLEAPPVSSIMVNKSTGERAVISINAKKTQVTSDQLSPDILQKVDIVLVDGHQMAVGQAIAQQASIQNIPIVLDGGSWKSGLENLLPFVNYAICSANFYPPGCQNQQDVLAYLSAVGIPHIAITYGEKSIQALNNGQFSWVEVPLISAVDTLGAGDILHGAFCHYILQTNFTEALTAAAKIASYSCQFFGTRSWMNR